MQQEVGACWTRGSLPMNVAVGPIHHHDDISASVSFFIVIHCDLRHHHYDMARDRSIVWLSSAPFFHFPLRRVWVLGCIG